MSSPKTTAKLKTATVLAFERNLDISDAVFTQIDSANPSKKAVPVAIIEKSVRGTISNRLKSNIASDPLKLNAELEKPNLQKVDAAALSEDCDTLIVNWSLKALPFTGKPNVCNNQDYQEALESTVKQYLTEHGVGELARRYAINIANARWLWRNRVGAETISVTVTSGDEKMMFDGKDISLQTFDTNDEHLDKLASLIEAGLKGESFVILYIQANVKAGYGQEVYPSQELVLDTGKSKSKVLYSVNEKAGMHSQKVSNAIRTIDTWYPDAEFPIAVEPYGAVTTLGKAFRQPKQKMDFYSLFDNWVLKGEKPDIDQQHYVMGVLIRGGVFGASGKE